MSSGQGTKPKEVDYGGVKPPPRMSALAPFVFWPSVVIIGAFVIWAMIAGEGAADTIANFRGEIVDNASWYYVPLVSSFVVLAIYVGLSKFGRIRLGRDDQKPDFSYGSWLAMLFAAGMGIGLVFWGVAEPLNFYAAPKPGVGEGEAERAEAAMSNAFLHWGLHPWAIYVVVGLAIAYAVHRKGRPVSIRWTLQPIFGDRVKGRLGDVIDVIAVVGTVFGVVTSLGLGVLQIGAGLDFMGWAEDPGEVLLSALVVGIMLLAIISVVTGLDKGIKWLSNINVVIAGGVLLFVLLAGSTMMLLTDTFQNLGIYLQNLPALSLDTGSWFGEDGTGWIGGWTIFYWGWWISWAPFVGIFIARISRGRTVREFVGGALAVPVAVSFFWFSVLGGSGIREEQANGGMVDPDGTVNNDQAFFRLLDTLPGGTLVAGIVILLIVLFFVTSADSASYVVDMLASGGDPNPPTWSRVFWASLTGLAAIAVLLTGGEEALGTLQSVAVMSALPFSIVMIAMCIALMKSFRAEHRAYEQAVAEAEHQELVESTVAALENGDGDGGNGGGSGGNGGGTGPTGGGSGGGDTDTPQDKVPTG